MSDEPATLAAQFLLAVRHGENADSSAEQLANIEPGRLAAALDTEAAKLAFWINVYNAATQRALADDPSQYENRRAFFNASLVRIAGHPLSLDDMEHGILRRSYAKLSMGYMRKPGILRSETCDRFAVAERDPRIHFALNCGARSCPPIAAYEADAIEDQLDMATRGYLDQAVEYDPEPDDLRARLLGGGRAVVPRLLLWYRGDFGGKSGIHDFLREYEQIPATASPRLSYHDWNWAVEPGAFADEEYVPTDEAIES